jgi:hypothetical protein
MSKYVISLGIIFCCIFILLENTIADIFMKNYARNATIPTVLKLQMLSCVG